MTLQTPEHLLERLLSDLEDYPLVGDTKLEDIRNAMDVALSHRSSLLAYLASSTVDGRDEVRLFKHIKPQFDGRVVFLKWIHTLVALLPLANKDNQRAYYHCQISEVQRVYLQYADLRLYMNAGMSHLDGVYFTRWGIPANQLEHSVEYLLSDVRFNAPKSHDLARLTACQLMDAYLNQQVTFLSSDTIPKGNSSCLTWTASKAAIVELIYALQEFGVFNDSKPEIKKVADFFSNVFNINIGNVYKIYEDNRLRKKNRTPFLDNLRNALIRRMELDDEHAL